MNTPKRLFLLMSVLILTTLSNSQIIYVNEIMFKPGPNASGCDQKMVVTTPGSGLTQDCGREYIELYNSDCENAFDLSGFVLASAQSFVSDNLGAICFPPGTVVPPGGFLVIGGPGPENNYGDSYDYLPNSIDFVLRDYIGTPYLCVGSPGYWYMANFDGWIGLYEPDGSVHYAIFWSSDVANLTDQPADFGVSPCSPAAYSGPALKKPEDMILNVEIFYAGDPSTTPMGKTLSRIPDGGPMQPNRPPTIGPVHSDNCNDGTCFSCGALTLDATPDTCTQSVGTITCTVDGLAVTPPFDYTVTGPYSTTVTTSTNPYVFVNLPAGDYTITVEDAGGSVVTKTITVGDIGGPTISLTSTPDTCNLGVGTATVNVSGGSTAINYLWSDSDHQNTPLAIGLSTGNYSVTVSNSDGTCPVNGNVNVASTGNITLTSSSVSATCNLADGSATVNPNVDPAQCNYFWTPSGQTTQTASNIAAGTYNVEVEYFGCVSEINITVNSNDVGLTATLNPVDEVCSMANGSITLTVSENPAQCTYSWNTGQNTQNLSDLDAGTYTVTVNYFGCTTSESAIIGTDSYTINNSVSQTNVTCFGENDGSANISSSGGATPYSYLWSNGLNTSVINYLMAGTYSVTVQDAAGCTSGTSVTITQPSLLSASLPEDMFLCSNESTGITCGVSGGTPPHSYHWSTGENTASINPTPTSTSTYAVTITDAAGCTAGESITLSTYPALTLNIGSNATIVCPGDPVVISGSYSGGKPPYTITSGSTITSFPVTVYPEVSQVYVYTVTDLCGTTATDDISLSVYEEPSIMFVSDVTSGCQPLTVNITSLGDCDGCSYIWDFDDIYHVNLSLDQNPEHEFSQPGIYDVTCTVENGFGCKSTLTYHDYIQVFQSPEAGFYTDPLTATIINPDVSCVNQSVYATEYEWMFGDGDSSNYENPQHAYSEPGNYNIELIAITEHGCRDTASYEILIGEETTFYAPTAFRPDADGLNDQFYVVGTGISQENFLMVIFDRWGEPVFETSNFNPEDPSEYGWNGRIKENDFAPTGTYTWLVRYKDVNNAMHEVAGAVTLLR